MQALASLFTCGQRVAVQGVDGQNVTLTDSFNSGTGEFTRKVERQRVAVQGDSPRKFICAEGVDGQKNNAIV